jgi:hypothetical protein
VVCWDTNRLGIGHGSRLHMHVPLEKLQGLGATLQQNLGRLWLVAACCGLGGGGEGHAAGVKKHGQQVLKMHQPVWLRAPTQ